MSPSRAAATRPGAPGLSVTIIPEIGFEMVLNGAARFLSARWHGEVPLATLFWRDMLVVGTALNLALAFAALMALGFKAPLWVALTFQFAAVPYNVFLFLAVGKRARLERKQGAGFFTATALAWLVAAALV